MSGPSDKRKPRKRSYIDLATTAMAYFRCTLFLSRSLTHSLPFSARPRSLLRDREFYRKCITRFKFQGNVLGRFYFPLREMKFVISPETFATKRNVQVQSNVINRAQLLSYEVIRTH